LQERGGKLLFVAGHGWDCRCVFGATEREHEAEGVFPVQVEAVEALLRDEAERRVQPEGGRVVELGLEGDLGERGEARLRSDVSSSSDARCQGKE
jgi:hypothetical protein